MNYLKRFRYSVLLSKLCSHNYWQNFIHFIVLFLNWHYLRGYQLSDITAFKNFWKRITKTTTTKFEGTHNIYLKNKSKFLLISNSLKYLYIYRVNKNKIKSNVLHIYSKFEKPKTIKHKACDFDQWVLVILVLSEIIKETAATRKNFWIKRRSERTLKPSSWKENPLGE